MKVTELKLMGNRMIQGIMTICNKLISKINIVVCVNLWLLDRKRDNFIYNYDYVRNSSLELTAYEINKRQLKGNVAELGVYRGDFAKNINRAFPNRKLYLFDTFEGFDQADLTKEKDKGYSVNGENVFSNTNVKLVMGKMKYRENCIIKKGFFPETAKDVDDRFVFVSIDCDLYDPILSGLEYFYPRLERGGYIFVHDYQSALYKGAREAVNEFLGRNQDICCFPLSDPSGTMVIMK